MQIIELTSNVPIDDGFLVIRPFVGKFTDHEDTIYGFMAYDSDQTTGVYLGLRTIPKDPIDLVKECFYVGDIKFEQMLAKTITKQRQIKCPTKTLEFHEYISAFVKDKSINVIELAP